MNRQIDHSALSSRCAIWSSSLALGVGRRHLGHHRQQESVAQATNRRAVPAGSGLGWHADHRDSRPRRSKPSTASAPRMTDSSAWLIQNELTQPQRDKLMRQLFSPTAGIGINYLRVPMGASDFTASGFYTYNDNPPGGTDDFQQHFSIAHDEAYIIPQLQQAPTLNPDLKLMATPWSAPAWMKTNNSLTGGSLKPQWEACVRPLSRQIHRGLRRAGACRSTRFQLQNEPLHTSNYPTMSMSADAADPTHQGPRRPALRRRRDHDQIPGLRPQLGQARLSDPSAQRSRRATIYRRHRLPCLRGQRQRPDHGSQRPSRQGHLFHRDHRRRLGDQFRRQSRLESSEHHHRQHPQLGEKRACSGISRSTRTTTRISTAAPIAAALSRSTTPTGAVTFNEEFYVLGQVTKAVQPGAIRVNSTTNSATQHRRLLESGRLAGARSRSIPIPRPRRSASSKTASILTIRFPANRWPRFFGTTAGPTSTTAVSTTAAFSRAAARSTPGRCSATPPAMSPSQNEAVLAGDKSLKLFGQFNGSANTSGVSQGITVAAGDELTASLSALVRSADSIAGTANFAEMKIEFYNQHGGAFGSANFLGEEKLLVADAASAIDQWLSRQLIGMAAAGAVEARLVLQFIQPNNQTVPSTSTTSRSASPTRSSSTGDYDASGVVDEADYRGLEDQFWVDDPACRRRQRRRHGRRRRLCDLARQFWRCRSPRKRRSRSACRNRAAGRWRSAACSA